MGTVLNHISIGRLQKSYLLSAEECLELASKLQLVDKNNIFLSGKKDFAFDGKCLNELLTSFVSRGVNNIEVAAMIFYKFACKEQGITPDEQILTSASTMPKITLEGILKQSMLYCLFVKKKDALLLLKGEGYELQLEMPGITHSLIQNLWESEVNHPKTIAVANVVEKFGKCFSAYGLDKSVPPDLPSTTQEALRRIREQKQFVPPPQQAPTETAPQAAPLTGEQESKSPLLTVQTWWSALQDYDTKPKRRKDDRTMRDMQQFFCTKYPKEAKESQIPEPLEGKREDNYSRAKKMVKETHIPKLQKSYPHLIGFPLNV